MLFEYVSMYTQFKDFCMLLPEFVSRGYSKCFFFLHFSFINVLPCLFRMFYVSECLLLVYFLIL